MIYGLWQSAGGLQAQEYRQTLLANNLANVDTPGFRADRVAFSDRLNAAAARGAALQAPELKNMTGGVFETEVYTDYAFKDASLVPTGNPLDVAVQGEGFLAVQSSAGPRYTRDGRMIMDASGALIHAASGRAMLDIGGRPITLDPTSREGLKIDARGVIRQGDTPVGQLAVVDFTDRGRLTKEGENLFVAQAAPDLAATGQVRQALHEGSNVEPARTLVDMIAAARAYEANARLISLQDESLGRVVNDVGRVG